MSNKWHGALAPKEYSVPNNLSPSSFSIYLHTDSPYLNLFLQWSLKNIDF